MSLLEVKLNAIDDPDENRSIYIDAIPTNKLIKQIKEVILNEKHKYKLRVWNYDDVQGMVELFLKKKGFKIIDEPNSISFNV